MAFIALVVDGAPRPASAGMRTVADEAPTRKRPRANAAWQTPTRKRRVLPAGAGRSLNSFLSSFGPLFPKVQARAW